MSSITERIRLMRQETKKNETKLSTGGQRRGSFMSIQDLQEGKTTIRIVKNEKDEIPFVPFRSTWLEVEEKLINLSRYHLNNIIKEKKLEKVLGVKDIKDLEDKSDEEVREMISNELGAGFTRSVNKRVFISKVHGDSDIPDIVEKKRKQGIIRGYRDKQGKWISGIMPSTSYMTHCIDFENRSNGVTRLEIWEKHMNDIEKLYASFDEEDQPLTIDPFSDPKEGIPLVIEKVKNEKGKFDYIISDKKNTSRSGSYLDFVKQFELTSEEIDEVNGSQALTDIYMNVYGKRDFELALSGLQLFESKNNINAFESDTFLDIVESIGVKYEDDQKEETKKAETKKVEPKVETKKVTEKKVELKADEKKADTKKSDSKKEEISSGDDSPYGSTIDELKKYIADNDLGIRVMSRYTFSDIVEMIDEVLTERAGVCESSDEDGAADMEVPEENSVVEEEEKPAININDLRARLLARKS